MLSKLFGSLFFRLALLVVTVVVATQLFTTWMAEHERFKLLERQLYIQVLDTLSFLEDSMNGMNPQERQEYLDNYNRPGLPNLLPYNADKSQKFEPELPKIGRMLAERLSHDLNEPIQAHFGRRADHRELWVHVHVLDQAYWLVIPFGRYRDKMIGSLLQSSLIAALFATLLASLFAWRITRPISRVVQASRELAGGTMPKPVPETGPREVRLLAHNFNRMALELDNAARERRLMLAGLSHDLRTPLTRLKLTLEMQADTPDQHDMLSDIDELSRIVRQFIDFARAEESNRLEPLALADLAASVVSRFRREGMDVRLEQRSEPELLADALALERLLSNLLENARRYGQPPVIVRIEQQPGEVELSVIDHGKGIPAEFRESALAPFERLAEHRGTDGGSGLGLAIVSRVVKQHNGKLTLTDENDAFKVSIRFPTA
ncbi:ATP-binding protein [Chromobacterium sp. IIBBL 290-4]|uniref:ATP-binding protein n=1 Tax=Chromobacterium sp. IIBBL 290-4 TaxID=2953890 RepID=UPI0020B6C565|nr:ATP-binding protein [Chromobacterium sp. IIBBL 290-4]UTH75890.1 ATP-binding protein [Chromobacterium sp. IIBBL 290-4]